MDIDRYTVLGFMAVVVAPVTLVATAVSAMSSDAPKEKSPTVSQQVVEKPAKPYEEMSDEEKFDFVVANDGKYSGAACEGMLKAASKYPTKIKMDWGAKIKHTYWTDGNSTERGIIRVTKNGEAMNGFGAMLPFTGVCEFSINLDTKKAVPKTVLFDGKKVL